jgi:hypothetical protein
MIAMTTVSALPAIEADGTICEERVWKRAGNQVTTRLGNSPPMRLAQG